MGLSPLARGNPLHIHDALARLGSIPARAGEPMVYRAPAATRKVYPRSRGGTVLDHAPPSLISGLSPLARGNRRACVGTPLHDGSIPARAGEPTNGTRLLDSRRVYPRSRGGTVEGILDLIGNKGLSPLARGNRIGTVATR